MLSEKYQPKSIFLKSREKNLFTNPLYNKFFLTRFVFLLKFLFFLNGKCIKTYNSYKDVGNLIIASDLYKQKNFLLLSVKNKKIKKNKSAIIEIWQKKLCNFKKISQLCLDKKFCLWDLNWNFYPMTKANGFLILSTGSAIKIIKMPNVLPNNFLIKNFFFQLEFYNTFNWKMEITNYKIVFGDVHGKIIFIDFFENFSWRQIDHNKHKNSPVGSLKILDYGKQRNRYLISGGLDGCIKIWDIFYSYTVVRQISFPRRWIVDIIQVFPKKKKQLLLVGLDNGVQILITSHLKFCYSFRIPRKDRFLQNFTCDSSIMIPGRFGLLNLFEYNGPICKTNYLNFIYSNFPNFKKEKKIKQMNQIIDFNKKKYDLMKIQIELISKKKKIFFFLSKTGILLTMQTMFL
jgi:WD40 repeat protein